MTLSIADEIRTNTKAIVAQLRGFSKQPPHLQKVTLPAPFFSQIADKIETLEAEAAAPKPCPNCGEQERPFPINPRNRPIDFHWQMNRLKRMQREDAAIEAELFGEGA